MITTQETTVRCSPAGPRASKFQVLLAAQKLTTDVSSKPFIHFPIYGTSTLMEWSSGSATFQLYVGGGGNSYDIISTDSLLLAVDEIFYKCIVNSTVQNADLGQLGVRKAASIRLQAH